MKNSEDQASFSGQSISKQGHRLKSSAQKAEENACAVSFDNPEGGEHKSASPSDSHRDLQGRLPRPSAAQLAAPCLTVGDPHPELPKTPQLKRKDVFIPVDSYYDQVPIHGKFKLVDYQDLKDVDLLPKHAVTLPSLEKPVLVSRFISLGGGRLACLIYVPNDEGKYVPRPVYQSRSHAAWQAPNYIVRGSSRRTGRWNSDAYYGKGCNIRGKMGTAVEPELQKFLSEHSPKEFRDNSTTETERNVLVGLSSNQFGEKDDFDQTFCNFPVALEEMYPGSRVDSQDACSEPTGKTTPLSPKDFKLPNEAWPDFKSPSLTYATQNDIYGPIRAEVFPSKDGKLRWTYYRQSSTNRVWVAHVHRSDSKTADTGLPQNIVDAGRTIQLAPCEYRSELKGTFGLWWLQSIPNTKYMDIWKKYTSQLPLVQAYYQAKKLPCPD